MKKLVHKITSSFLILLTVASCQKVDELSDITSITAVSVVSAKSVNTPEGTIINSTPIIKGDTIIVPLLAGAKLFPMVLTFDIETSGAEQLTNFEEGDKFTFDDLTHHRKFYTVAASGSTKAWFVKIDNLATRNGAEVLQAEYIDAANIANVGVNKFCIINPIKSEVNLAVISGLVEYPLTTDIKFVLSDSSKLITELPINKDGSYTFVFNSAIDTLSVDVQSQTENIKKWRVGMSVLSNADTDLSLNQTTNSQRKALTINASEISIENPSAELIRTSTMFVTSIYDEVGKVRIFIKDKQQRSVEFPVNVKLNLPAVENQTVIGVPHDGTLAFSSYDDVANIYVQESLSGLVKRWLVSLAPAPNATISNVRDIDMSTSVKGITIDGDIIFDEAALKIIVPITWSGGAIGGENLKIRLGCTYTDPSGKNVVVKKPSAWFPNLTYLNSISYFNVNIGVDGLTQRWSIYLKDTKAVAKSSDTSVSEFRVSYYYSPKELLTLTNPLFQQTIAAVDKGAKTLTLTVNNASYDMPLTIDMYSIQLSNGMANITTPEFNSAKVPVVFNDLSSTHSFTVLAEDSVTEEVWTLKLSDTSKPLGSTAELVDITTSDLSEGVQVTNIEIKSVEKEVVIDIFGDVTPIYISANITTSDNSYVTGIYNDVFMFDTYKDVNRFTITSEDGTITNDWTVKLKKVNKVQIPNSNFESWGEFADINNGTKTLNPYPGVGRGWATANIKLLGVGAIGSNPVNHLDGFAAEMSTTEESASIKGRIMAAGTVYTGKFDGSDPLNNMATPWLMTHFGIPFDGKPVSFNLDIKYNAGHQLRQAILSGSTYSVSDIDGIDEAHIWVKLLHWSKIEPLKFHDINQTMDGLTILADSELIISGSDKTYNEWQNIELPLNYKAIDPAINPTHLVVVMASSKRGGELIGATGSKLTVDNFVINY